MGSSSAAAKTLGRPVMAVTAATTARERAVVNVVAVAKVNFSTQTRVVVQRRFLEERCRFAFSILLGEWCDSYMVVFLHNFLEIQNFFRCWWIRRSFFVSFRWWILYEVAESRYLVCTLWKPRITGCCLHIVYMKENLSVPDFVDINDKRFPLWMVIVAVR